MTLKMPLLSHFIIRQMWREVPSVNCLKGFLGIPLECSLVPPVALVPPSPYLRTKGIDLSKFHCSQVIDQLSAGLQLPDKWKRLYFNRVPLTAVGTHDIHDSVHRDKNYDFCLLIASVIEKNLMVAKHSEDIA